MKFDSSDPLPFLQIDRGAKESIGLLAGLMKCSYQHAVGTMVEFWGRSSDPRELLRIVQETPNEIEPEVVLSGPQIEARFDVASGGHKIKPEQMVELRFLEPKGDHFRLRGMSRYFDAIKNSKANAINGKLGAYKRWNKPETDGPAIAPISILGRGAIAKPLKERGGLWRIDSKTSDVRRQTSDLKANTSEQAQLLAPPKDDHEQKLLDEWNSIDAPGKRNERMTASKRVTLTQMMGQRSLTQWRAIFERGLNPLAYSCGKKWFDLDWLAKPSNAEKVVAGNYDPEKPKENPSIYREQRPEQDLGVCARCRGSAKVEAWGLSLCRGCFACGNQELKALEVGADWVEVEREAKEWAEKCKT